MKNNAEQVYLEHKARIYILRCITKCDCLLQIVQSNYFDFVELSKFLSANPRHKFHNNSKQKSLSTQELKQESQDENLQKLLKQTMRSCKNTLNLKPAEVLLIEFLVIKDRVMILDDVLGIFSDISQAKRTYMVSKILNVSFKDITMILNNNSTLIKLEIIDKMDNFYRGFRMLCFRDSGFSDILTSCDKNSFVNYFAIPCNKSHLLPRNYAHIKEFSAVQSYLKSVINKKQKGVNILLYGKPGTGKSAFAQFIAKSLKRPCIIKAVSDLESAWLGGTEKNIARAFKEAKDKKLCLSLMKSIAFCAIDALLCEDSRRQKSMKCFCKWKNLTAFLSPQRI